MKRLFIALIMFIFASAWCFAEEVPAIPGKEGAKVVENKTTGTVKKATKVKKNKISKKAKKQVKKAKEAKETKE